MNALLVFRLRAVLLAVLSSTLLVSGQAEARFALTADITRSLDDVAHADESAPLLYDGTTRIDLGPLPESTAVAALGFDPTGDVLFSVETTTRLPGGLVAEPRDVVRWDGADYSLELDGSSVSLPEGTKIDAISKVLDLLLSFDTTVRLPGGLVAADEDLVAWRDGVFQTPLFFDGSAAGVPDGLDVDAAHQLPEGRLLLSFDASGQIGRARFDDEDLVEYDRILEAWALELDVSTIHGQIEAADLDGLVAVPEPTFGLALLCVAATAAGLGRRRR